MTEGPYNGLPPFERGSETSHEAAMSLGGSARTMRERVYAYLATCGKSGCTDDELETALRMRHQTASARRRELVLLGQVFKAGFRRRTSSGRSADVYSVLAPPETEAAR
jgi:hypothetical protein